MSQKHRSIEQIKADIEDVKIAISEETNAEDKKIMESALADLEKELKEAEEAKIEAIAEGEKKPEKPAKTPKAPKTGAPKKASKKEKLKEAVEHQTNRAHEIFMPKKQDKEIEKFEKAEQKRELEEAEEKHKKQSIIQVDGKHYDLEDCRQAILAVKARVNQSKRYANKHKTKSDIVKAADKVETLISNIHDAIPEKTIDNKPKEVIAALNSFKHKMEDAFSALNKIIPETSINKLKKALKEAIDEAINEVKE